MLIPVNESLNKSNINSVKLSNIPNQQDASSISIINNQHLKHAITQKSDASFNANLKLSESMSNLKQNITTNPLNKTIYIENIIDSNTKMNNETRREFKIPKESTQLKLNSIFVKSNAGFKEPRKNFS